VVLHEYLKVHIPGYGEETKVRKFSLGQSNPTYLINGEYVLRKQPPGKKSNKIAHRTDREFFVMQCLEKSGVPVPKMYFDCEKIPLCSALLFTL